VTRGLKRSFPDATGIITPREAITVSVAGCDYLIPAASSTQELVGPAFMSQRSRSISPVKKITVYFRQEQKFSVPVVMRIWVMFLLMARSRQACAIVSILPRSIFAQQTAIKTRMIIEKSGSPVDSTCEQMRLSFSIFRDAWTHTLGLSGAIRAPDTISIEKLNLIFLVVKSI